MDLVCRTSRTVRCNAQKGFGTSAPKRKGAKSGPAKTPEQAAERALAEASGPRNKVRPIDPREAARGKVDYVQVKDWADGQAGDIGELAMVPGTLSTGFTTGSSSPSAAASAAAAAAAAEDSGPFWQQLAQHAQYLERQGALSIAEMRGAKPYMPFEAWQYNLQRYKQYLAEIVAVHQAIEAALRLALSAAQNSNNSSSSSSSGQAAWAVPGRDEQVLQAYSALQCFGLESGLWRAAAATADLHALSAAAAGAAAQGESASRAGSQQTQSQGATQSEKSSLEAEVQASQNAVAYGRYILQLGQAAAAATAEATAAAIAATAGTKDTGLSAEEEGGRAAALKLLAHAYALQVQQQCLGARIGAAAAEKLQLLPARALALYMDYPASIRGEPVEHLMELTDAAGQILDAAGRQAVFEELPKALKKSALMLAPLATAE